MTSGPGPVAHRTSGPGPVAQALYFHDSIKVGKVSSYSDWCGLQAPTQFDRVELPNLVRHGSSASLSRKHICDEIDDNPSVIITTRRDREHRQPANRQFTSDAVIHQAMNLPECPAVLQCFLWLLSCAFCHKCTPMRLMATAKVKKEINTLQNAYPRD